jgi:hypothetical protein
MKMTNRKAQQMYNAVRVLGNRRMNGLDADLKVMRLIAYLTPIIEPLAALKRAKTEELLNAGEFDTPLAQDKLAIQLAIAMAEVDDALVTLEPNPEWFLDREDLPQDKKGDKNSGNADGLGAILADLGLLFLDA